MHLYRIFPLIQLYCRARFTIYPVLLSFTVGWRFMFLVTLLPIMLVLLVLYASPESNVA